MDNRQIIVISAVNLTQGGPLTILLNCLQALSDNGFTKKYRVIALVNKCSIFHFTDIEFVEYPKAKKKWFNRIYYEYYFFLKLSKQLNPYLWLSLHDITPNVKATIRAVYCHNSTPFFKLKAQDLRFDFKVVLFALFYKYLYRINIKKNDYVIVQQQWLREEFCHHYMLNSDKVIVAYANVEQSHNISGVIKNEEITNVTNFFYPSLARQFKNFETVCRAVEILEAENVSNFRVSITIDGSENRYSQWIYNKYKHLKCIDFLGLVPSDKMDDKYLNTDCLIFASRLESWGLPISEFSQYDRPMLIADLQYAHETSSGAQKIAFFDPYNANELAAGMRKLINGDFSMIKPQNNYNVAEPFTKSWNDLFVLLTTTAKNE